MYLLEKLREHLDNIAIILIFSLMGMGIYALSSKEPMIKNSKNTLLGGLMCFILPTWLYFRMDQCGRFILIQRWLLHNKAIYT